MNIDDLTIKDALKIAEIFGATQDPTHHWEIGENYLIRTVTHIQTGRVVAVSEHEVVLEDAAWIADTGRFSGALASCDFSEVEPFPSERRVLVGRGALIDAVQIETLPRELK